MVKRNGNYSSEAIYVIYGVKEDNTRELLLVEVNPTESAAIWGEGFAKLQKRGVNQVDLIVADGITGLDKIARYNFPEADLREVCCA